MMYLKEAAAVEPDGSVGHNQGTKRASSSEPASPRFESRSARECDVGERGQGKTARRRRRKGTGNASHGGRTGEAGLGGKASGAAATTGAKGRRHGKTFYVENPSPSIIPEPGSEDRGMRLRQIGLQRSRVAWVAGP